MAIRYIIPLGLLAALLSGCAGSDPDPAQDPGAPQALAGTSDLSLLATLDANSSLAAPVPWAVGDWFGVHVFVGMEDTQGVHYNTIVVEETTDTWVLASDDAGAAKQEAAFDFPILGPFRKADLGTSGLGGRWDLLKFPLADGATWSSTVALDPEDPSGGNLKLEFEATFNDRIPTADGPKPGYDIVAVDADARQVLAFDYVPAMGWFTRFQIFDTATEDPLDYFIAARSMGTGHNWRGTYYLDTATPVLQHFNIIGVDPEDPTSPYLEARPYAAFTVSEGATYLYGFIFSFSFTGAHDVILADPANQPREFRSYNVGVAGEGADATIDEAAMPGEWQLLTVGAGVVAGGGAFLWEITETTGTL